MLDTQTQVNNYPFLYFNDLSKPSADRYTYNNTVIVLKIVLRKVFLPNAMITVRLITTLTIQAVLVWERLVFLRIII